VALDKYKEGLFSPTPTPTTVRFGLFYGMVHDFLIAIAVLSTAFMHADISEEMHCRPPVRYHDDGWPRKIEKASNGMKHASADFSMIESSLRRWRSKSCATGHWSRCLMSL